MSDPGQTTAQQCRPSFIRETGQLRTHVGLIDLSNRDRICLLGNDRHRFLNGQVTNNIRDLKTGTGCYTLCTNNKGVIQGDATAYGLEDEILLDLEPGQGAAFGKRLEAFIISDDVEIVDVAPHFQLLSLQGPLAEQAILQTDALGIHTLPEDPHEITRGSNDEDGEFYITNHARIGTQGYDLFVAADRSESLKAQLKQSVERLGGALCSEKSLEPLRIEAGIPRFPVDMEPAILAPELGIESKTISYSKGCYIGQEVINRIKSVGRVKRRLIGLRFSSDAPPPGSLLFHEDKKAGLVLSSAFSTAVDGVIGLALIKTSHSEPGTQLSCSVDENSPTLSAQVTPLPFSLSNKA